MKKNFDLQTKFDTHFIFDEYCRTFQKQIKKIFEKKYLHITSYYFITHEDNDNKQYIKRILAHCLYAVYCCNVNTSILEKKKFLEEIDSTKHTFPSFNKNALIKKTFKSILVYSDYSNLSTAVCDYLYVGLKEEFRKEIEKADNVSNCKS